MPMTHITGLITPLDTTHEPPSRVWLVDVLEMWDLSVESRNNVSRAVGPREGARMNPATSPKGPCTQIVPLGSLLGFGFFKGILKGSIGFRA